MAFKWQKWFCLCFKKDEPLSQSMAKLRVGRKNVTRPCVGSIAIVLWPRYSREHFHKVTIVINPHISRTHPNVCVTWNVNVISLGSSSVAS
jgi:hypothetical protein